MNTSHPRIITALVVVILLAIPVSVQAEMGMALPMIKNGQGFLDSKKTTTGTEPMVTSARTLGEMGVPLPTIKEGEGLLDSKKTAKTPTPVITSIHTLGEMGVGLPVIGSGGTGKSVKTPVRADAHTDSEPVVSKNDKDIPKTAEKRKMQKSETAMNSNQTLVLSK